MRVLYGIQCTGNGHITRSIDFVNELRKYVRVDVVTSGADSDVKLPFSVKYKLNGLSYYFGKNGSFDLLKTLFGNNVFRFVREINAIPVHYYDLVVSDFEPISAWAAKKHWVYCVALSNQAALVHSKVKKPKVFSPISKLIIDFFCPSDKQYGLFYQKYSEDLYFPPIRSEVLSLQPTFGDYYVVYLPFYGEEKIVSFLKQFPNEKWKVFSKHAKKKTKIGTIEVMPISQKAFLKSLEGCKGVICSAGFGTTSEALYLKKKLLVVPMKNQYEQLCNAYALSQNGVLSIKNLKKKNKEDILDWLSSNEIPNINFVDEKQKVVKRILTDYIKHFEGEKGV
jgi:uncharacterized protein (TIGR00661 family)